MFAWSVILPSDTHIVNGWGSSEENDVTDLRQVQNGGGKYRLRRGILRWRSG
jgi:hypothetical protein